MTVPMWRMVRQWKIIYSFLTQLVKSVHFVNGVAPSKVEHIEDSESACCQIESLILFYDKKNGANEQVFYATTLLDIAALNTQIWTKQ